MISRAESSLFLSHDGRKGAKEALAEEVRGMAKRAEDPNRVPCGTRRDPGLSQRPLEQMGSISYFVTPPFHRRAVSFSRAPTHLAIYFVVIYISRPNVPSAPSSAAHICYTRALSFSLRSSPSTRGIPCYLFI